MKNHPIVALEHCPGYEADCLQKAIGRLIHSLGGIGAFVKRGQSVLIKPNMLTDAFPEKAITTNPEVVRAIIRMVKKHGANPFVADSPSNVVKIESVWKKTGFQAMCSEEHTPLVNLEKTGAVSFEVDGFAFSIAKPVLDADVIINVPKVKTHMLTMLTAAVKNMFGAVPGFQKMNLHKDYPKPDEFGKLLAVIYRHVPPHLNIADAIIGMDGDGPSAGRPFQMGLLAASSDAVALDLALCRILQLDPKIVPYLQYLAVSGNSEGKEPEVDIVGASMSEFIVKDFIAPGTMPSSMIPGWLVKLLAPFVWIAPSISGKCITCGRCVKCCPVNALSLIPGAARPVLERKKCIGCCCCHEICPEKAISMMHSPLLTLVRRCRKP